jgi:hypothetical protein
MAKFEPGKSGNPRGRPTKEMQALRDMDKSELEAVLKKLKRASPEAVTLIIAAMHDETIPKKDRLRYAKEVFDMFTKAISLDNTLRKNDNGSTPAETEDDEPKQPAVVFKLV